jgi:DNA-binding MarR family transcriptional regulator
LDLAANHRESGKGRSLLERIENPKDLRSTIYKLSPKGKMLIGQLMEALAELPADNPEVGTEG